MSPVSSASVGTSGVAFTIDAEGTRKGSDSILQSPHADTSLDEGPVPVVSVIVPVFNVEKYLANCLQSLRDQTLRALEVVVVLDAPTDSSSQIAERFASDDSRFRVVRHMENAGCATSRNTV